MVLGGPDLDSGSGGGDVSITSTSSDDDEEVLDLGQQASGGSTDYDLGSNAGAVVDTGDEIADAGGPDAVLAGTQEQVEQVNKTVSKVSDQIKNAATPTTNGPDDVPSQAETARRNAMNAASGAPNGPKALLGAVLSFLSSLVSAVVPGGN
jgi:hypothetical protein